MFNEPQVPQKQITDEMRNRSEYIGISEERLKFLLNAGMDYIYDENGRRIEPQKRVTSTNFFIERKLHHMIKPDPNGVFYLKVTIKGKTIVKPLDKDENKSIQMRDELLRAMNFEPSRHSAR